MARTFNYKAVAVQLRKYGFKPKYGSHTKGSASPQSKAALKRQWNKVRLFTPGGSKQKFKFVVTNTPDKVEAMKGMNPKVRTPTGFFVRVPAGVKHYRVSFKGGQLKISAEGKRGGKRTERIYRLNSRSLAKNPAAEIERVTGQKVGEFMEGRLVVNGHDSHTFEHNQLGEFEKYVAEFFLVSQDPNRASYLKGRYHGKKISPETFTDIFHVKIITQTKSRHVRKTTKRRKKKTKVRGR